MVALRKIVARFWVIIFILATIGAGFQLLWLADPLIGRLYDLMSEQCPIDNQEDINAVLNSFPKVAFAKLIKNPLSVRLGMTDQTLYGDKVFFEVNWFDRYQYLVGNIRVASFLTEDRLIYGLRYPIPLLEKRQLLFIDRDLLYALLRLQKELDKNGFDGRALQVTSGFRPPAINTLVGGADKSQHLMGHAVDLKVGDVDRDGKSDPKDIALVAQVLDSKILRGEGGIGVYKDVNSDPKECCHMHFDVRNDRARW